MRLAARDLSPALAPASGAEHVGHGASSPTTKHFGPRAVFNEVRSFPRLQRIAKLVTVGLMGGVAFLMGNTAPELGEPKVASAQAMTDAWLLAQKAQSLSDRRESEAALAAWQRAYDLSADPTLLLEIGRLERDKGNFARAAFAFERLLASGEERVPPQRLQLATRQLQAASARTARLQVQTNVVGAAVELEPDRGVSTSAGFVVNLLLDAGERRLSFGKPGYETRSLVVTLEPGEVRTLRVDLDKAVGGRSETGSSQPRWTRREAGVASAALL